MRLAGLLNTFRTLALIRKKKFERRSGQCTAFECAFLPNMYRVEFTDCSSLKADLRPARTRTHHGAQRWGTVTVTS
jgi:hypothetical protein